MTITTHHKTSFHALFSVIETFAAPATKVFQSRTDRLFTQQSFSLPEIMDTYSQQHIQCCGNKSEMQFTCLCYFICMLPSLGVYKYTPVIHIYLYMTISNATKEHYCRVNFVSTKETLRSFPVAKTGFNETVY